MLTFGLGQIPIQANLVDLKLLSEREKDWLKKHNATAIEKVMPLLGDDRRAKKWLRAQAVR